MFILSDFDISIFSILSILIVTRNISNKSVEKGSSVINFFRERMYKNELCFFFFFFKRNNIFFNLSMQFDTLRKKKKKNINIIRV